MITKRRPATIAANFKKRLATDRQAEILGVVIKLRDKMQRPPSLQELADECKIHKSAVFGHLKALQAKRYINWEPTVSRSLVVVKGIPLLGDVG